MRFALILVLLVAIGLLGYKAYDFYLQKKVIEEKYAELESRAQELEKSNEKIKKDLEYYSLEANLEKEAKSQFNYKLPDEKMIIVVPKR